jgi:NAD(P)-dependent dehydrogenase (short-subunit alcohol dehydrogenase family)
MAANAGRLLEDKVVVISGVGPALGTTLARRCAENGADLVLAARTVERLEDVAKQVTDMGRRAVSIGTDITDEAQAANLVEEALKAYGKVDVLINNAFRVPSMKPFAKTSFEHIRETIELTVLGALRLIQGFTPALAESKGSVVNVNSMVVRHSDPKQGAYKMAKSALLAMSQSLATELGGQGIRVNSVLPGYIWGGTLQGYFEHQAGKYGTTVDEIYNAAAVNSDLKRLPTEDEVASAILFMASDLSSGITGQALDVNCGEYHF